MTETLQDTADPVAEAAAAPKDNRGPGRRLMMPVSTVTAGALAVVGLIVAICFAVLWLGARGDIQDADAAAAREQRAIRVATDYAVGASKVEYADLDSWVGRLKANTAPPLAAKFDATAPKLKEILVPMQWNSTGTAAGAVAEPTAADSYVVDVFVDVESTGAQTPGPTRTTVHYVVTVDGAGAVVDVGGAGAALPLK